MVTREEMLLRSEISGCSEKELECIYQIGEDALFATITVDCNGFLTVICC